MKAIATENRRRTSPSYIPLPWHIFAEFWRTVWVGWIVTFGPDPARTTYTRREEEFHASAIKRFVPGQTDKALKGEEVYD
jgi:hypothetical protein